MRQKTGSRLPLAACCLASFLLLAYTTVVTVGVTAISRDLGAGYVTGQWVIDAYTLALAALMLALGSLGDRLGHRRLFLAGLATFTAATLGCAAAPTGPWLVAARAVQGVGGAAMFATVVPLLALGYPGRERARAFAVWGSVSAAGASAGTIAGGVVVQYASWRWLFLAAVPLCVVAYALGAVSLPRQPRRPGRLDVAGTVTVTVATAALTYAAIDAGEHGWTSPGTVAGLVVAVAGAAAFVLVERRATNPLLPAALFATRAFTAVLVVGFAAYLGAFAALPAVSGWLQASAGFGPLRTALLLCVQLVVFTAFALSASARLHAAPVARVLGGGTVVVGLGALAGTWLWLRPDWPALLVVLAVAGLGTGIVSPVLPAVAATSVPPAYAGTAGAAATAVRQLGLTVGVALCGALAHRYAAGHGEPAHGIAAALTLCGVVAVVAGVTGWCLLRRGSSGHDPSAPLRQRSPAGHSSR